ncbi:MAG: hypothetical protein GY754_33750 [bacterium]|nr:hypothetical protein [bacterium]
MNKKLLLILASISLLFAVSAARAIDTEKIMTGETGEINLGDCKYFWEYPPNCTPI